MNYRKNAQDLLEIYHPETDSYVPVAAPLQDQLGYVVSLSETAKQLILNLQGVLNTLNTLLAETDAEVTLIRETTETIAEDALTVASNTQTANTHLDAVANSALPDLLAKSTEISTLSNQIRLQIQSVEAELTTANTILTTINADTTSILSEASTISFQTSAISSSADSILLDTTSIKDSLGEVGASTVVSQVGAHGILTFVKSLFSFLRPQQVRWEITKVSSSGNYAIGANGIAIFRAKESVGSATIQGVGSQLSPFNFEAGRSYSASSANGQDSFTGIAITLADGAEVELISTRRI